MLYKNKKDSAHKETTELQQKFYIQYINNIPQNTVCTDYIINNNNNKIFITFKLENCFNSKNSIKRIKTI